MTRLPFTLPLILLITLPFSVSPLYAQPPDTLWTRTWDLGGNDEEAQSIYPTFDGGFVLGGLGNFGFGIRTAWIQRVDRSGDVVWQWDLGGSLTEGIHHVEQTQNGSFIAAGATLSYSPTQTFSSTVLKLSSQGQLLWASVWDHPSTDDDATCVRELPNGDVIVAAWHGYWPALWRLDAQGNTLWTSVFYDIPLSSAQTWFVEPTLDGGFVLATHVDFGNTNERKAVLIKADGDGDIIWYHSYPEEISVEAKFYCVRELANGDLVACGYDWDWETVDQWNDLYIVRTTQFGELIWEDRVEGEFIERARSLLVTPDNNLIVAGLIRGDIVPYFWTRKYDLDGDLLWEDLQPNGEGWSVCQARDGGYAVAGPRLVENYNVSEDFFMFKYEPEVTVDLVPEITLVPTEGGLIPYSGTMSNILLDETPMDLWATVTRAGGGLVRLQRFTINLQPGETVTAENLSLNVPAGAPDGVYRYEIHIGNHPDPMANMGLGTFTFWKGEVGVDDPSVIGYGNPNEKDFTWPGNGRNPFNGEPFDPNSPSPADGADPTIPTEPTLSAYPNPFNSVTTVSVFLPQPSELTVTVYNVNGQQVAQLARGHYAAGVHNIPVDASTLASGVYFLRSVLPGMNCLVQKVMLVR